MQTTTTTTNVKVRAACGQTISHPAHSVKGMIVGWCAGNRNVVEAVEAVEVFTAPLHTAENLTVKSELISAGFKLSAPSHDCACCGVEIEHCICRIGAVCCRN